ncbi:Adenylate cyclase, partial [Durusdinium trenchii]
MSNDRVSGTAKIGTRTSRVVRVLRLIRIIKLYKAIYEARQLQKKKEEMAKQSAMETQIYPGNEDDEDSYDDMEACSLRCV